MHTSVAHPRYKPLVGTESPGRVEVATWTHDSRIQTALSIPYECSVLDRKRARTHEQVTDGVRGVDSRPCTKVTDGDEPPVAIWIGLQPVHE